MSHWELVDGAVPDHGDAAKAGGQHPLVESLPGNQFRSSIAVELTPMEPGDQQDCCDDHVEHDGDHRRVPIETRLEKARTEHSGQAEARRTRGGAGWEKQAPQRRVQCHEGEPARVRCIRSEYAEPGRRGDERRDQRSHPAVAPARTSTYVKINAMIANASATCKRSSVASLAS